MSDAAPKLEPSRRVRAANRWSARIKLLKAFVGAESVGQVVHALQDAQGPDRTYRWVARTSVARLRRDGVVQ